MPVLQLKAVTSLMRTIAPEGKPAQTILCGTVWLYSTFFYPISFISFHSISRIIILGVYLVQRATSQGAQ